MRWNKTKTLVAEVATLCAGLGTIAWTVWYVMNVPISVEATNKRVDNVEKAFSEIPRKIDDNSMLMFHEFNKVNSRLGNIEGELKRIK